MDARQGFPVTLVLGASGRLGAILRRHWPSDWPVTWASRQPKSGSPGGAAYFRFSPLEAPPEALSGTLKRYDVILSLAGNAPGSTSWQNAAAGDDTKGQHESDPFAAQLAQHVALGGALGESAALAGVPLLLASSAAVYGDQGGLEPFSEADPLPSSVAPYGAAKRAMEKAALAPGGAVSCLRIGNVAGVDALLGAQRDGPVRLDTFPASDPLPETGPERSYVGPVSLARLLAALARQAANAASLPPRLNVAAPGWVSMEALLEAAEIPFLRQPAGPKAIRRVALNTALLERLVPVEARWGEVPTLISEWRHDQDLAQNAPERR